MEKLRKTLEFHGYDEYTLEKYGDTAYGVFIGNDIVTIRYCSGRWRVQSREHDGFYGTPSTALDAVINQRED